MDTDSNKVTWVVVIVAAVAIMGGLFVKFLPDITSQMQVYAQTVTGNLSGVDSSSNSDFTYSDPDTADDTISITGYKGHEENLIIPTYRKIGLVYYKITAISTGAFKGNTSIKQVTIPDSVKSIGYEAFFENSNLKSLMLGSGVTNIGDCAFEFNANLEQVTIPDSVKSIGDEAFLSDSNLKSLTLGSGVTSIGRGAFIGTALTRVDFPASVKSISGVAFGDTPISAISFKNRVDLGAGSFSSTNLKNVTLPTGSTYNTDSNNPTFDKNVNVTVK